jgi:hypothetical protein
MYVELWKKKEKPDTRNEKNIFDSIVMENNNSGFKLLLVTKLFHHIL